MTDIKTGPDFAFPMEDAPKDGSILRLLVKFDRKSAAGAFEDTTEPSWTIGTNNKANTGEDQWDIVGWSWEQDVFCHAYGAKAIGWLPFHTESNEPTALPPPSPAPAESGAVPSASMGRVTDLVWRVHDSLAEIAHTDFGPYMAERLGAASARAWFPDHRKLAAIMVEGFASMDEAKAACQASFASASAALDSPPDHGGGEGGVLVPREPTRDMLTAFVDADTDIDLSRTRYHAMLASLPPQESEDGR